MDFYPTPDPITAEREVLRGQLDINNSAVANRLPHLRANPVSAAFIHSYPDLETSYIIFNTRSVPPLKALAVRQAVSMAIDRDFIVNKLLRAGQVATTGFVPAGIGRLPSEDRAPPQGLLGRLAAGATPNGERVGCSPPPGSARAGGGSASS